MNDIPKRIGITGATGNLGHALYTWLLEKGFSVSILLRQEGVFKEKTKHKEFFGDITIPSTLESFIKNIDICIHLAALVNENNKANLYKTNVQGTFNICSAIEKFNPNCHLIYASTISATEVKYWNFFATTAYAKTKYKAEKWVKFFINTRNLNATIFYPGYIYGPFDTKFIPGVVKFLKQKNSFLVSGGETHAPLTYIFDLCELIEKIFTYPTISSGKAYCAISNNTLGMHDVILKIATQTNLKFPQKIRPKTLMYLIASVCECLFPLFSKPIPISRRHVHALSFSKIFSSELAKVELGWEPRASFDKNLSEAIHWAQNQGLI